MNLNEIIAIVEGTVLAGMDKVNREIPYCGASDLMSDVLTFSRPEALLVTGLTNAHVIRTAEMADLSAIIFVRGKQPGPDVVAMAEEKRIPLAASPLTMFEMCGRLYREGLLSCESPVLDLE